MGGAVYIINFEKFLKITCLKFYVLIWVVLLSSFSSFSLMQNSPAKKTAVLVPSCMLWIVALIACYFLVVAIALVGETTFYHTDAPFRMFSMLLRQEFYLNPIIGDHVYRAIARMIEQIPTLIAAWVGIDDLSTLRALFAFTLFSYYPLSWFLSYSVLPSDKKGLLLAPLLSFYLYSITNMLEISSEVHFLHALLWPLFFLLFIRNPQDMNKWHKSLTLLLLVLCWQSYESVFFYFAIALPFFLFRHYVMEFKNWRPALHWARLTPFSTAVLLLGTFVCGSNLWAILTFNQERYTTLAYRIQTSFSFVVFFPVAITVLLVFYSFFSKCQWFTENVKRVLLIVAMVLVVGALFTMPEGLSHYRLVRHLTAWFLLPAFLITGFFQKMFRSRDKYLRGILTMVVLIQIGVTLHSFVPAIFLNQEVKRLYSVHCGCIFTKKTDMELTIPDRYGTYHRTCQRFVFSPSVVIPLAVFSDHNSLKNFHRAFPGLKEHDGKFFSFSQLPSIYSGNR